MAACHAPILQFTFSLQRNTESERKSALQIVRRVKGHGSESPPEFVGLVLDGLDNQTERNITLQVGSDRIVHKIVAQSQTDRKYKIS